MRFFRREDGQLEALRKGNLEGRVDTGQLQGGNFRAKDHKSRFLPGNSLAVEAVEGG